MERVRFLQHKGKQLLHLDFSRAKADEVITIIDRAKAVIGAQPEGSVRTLTDVTDATFNTPVSEAMKDLVNHNKRFVIASAVVGVTGLKQIIYNAVVKFSGRNLVAFRYHGRRPRTGSRGSNPPLLSIVRDSSTSAAAALQWNMEEKL